MWSIFFATPSVASLGPACFTLESCFFSLQFRRLVIHSTDVAKSLVMCWVAPRRGPSSSSRPGFPLDPLFGRTAISNLLGATKLDVGSQSEKYLDAGMLTLTDHPSVPLLARTHTSSTGHSIDLSLFQQPFHSFFTYDISKPPSCLVTVDRAWQSTQHQPASRPPRGRRCPEAPVRPLRSLPSPQPLAGDPRQCIPPQDHIAGHTHVEPNDGQSGKHGTSPEREGHPHRRVVTAARASGIAPFRVAALSPVVLFLVRHRRGTCHCHC